jgi:triacylglycerol lipase
VPKEIAGELRALGGVVAPVETANLYASLHAKAPTVGVKVTIDIAYGPDVRHRLDVYEPALRPQHAMPVLIFVHGGGFVTGDKTEPNSPYYANIGYHFARRGILTMLATYRLAPQHTWPSGALDVAEAVKWSRDNVERFGGDESRIVLMGHSAGASHVAAYGLERRHQPQAGPGIAGLVLVSGLYDPALEYLARDVFFGGQRRPLNDAYYGTDENRYADQATLRHLDGPPLPTLIVTAELDPLSMQAEAAILFAALSERDKACPGYILLRDHSHSHLSEIYAINTPDEALSGPVLSFMVARAPRSQRGESIRTST